MSANRLAFSLVAVVALMLGAAFAAVPLYDLFCRTTGYGGTTQRATAVPGKVLAREMTVRFDASVAPGLPWAFAPEVRTMALHPGEQRLAFFRATNRSDKPVSGTATFNVTPEGAGGYFNKIACFCFQLQTLAPGESVEMPVSFFIDPAIDDDRDARRISEVTLSYTFFPAETPAATATTRRSGETPG